MDRVRSTHKALKTWSLLASIEATASRCRLPCGRAKTGERDKEGVVKVSI